MSAPRATCATCGALNILHAHTASECIVALRTDRDALAARLEALEAAVREVKAVAGQAYHCSSCGRTRGRHDVECPLTHLFALDADGAEAP